MSAVPVQSFWRPLLIFTKSPTCGSGARSPAATSSRKLGMLIRIQMRTAVRKEEITSFGTFLSTLCHEFCHHLDFQRFRFPDSLHTRAFTSELLIDLDRAPQLPDGLRVDAYVLTNGPELASSSRSPDATRSSGIASRDSCPSLPSGNEHTSA
jgi:hypothetical protein